MTDYAALLGARPAITDRLGWESYSRAQYQALAAALREVMAVVVRQELAYADLARLFDKRAQEHEQAMITRSKEGTT